MQITGGKYNSKKIKTPEYDNIKPTLSKTRQGIFNTLYSMIDFKDKVFLDMFSGSGIMSLEAYSRGFNVVSMEKERKTALNLKSLYKSLDFPIEFMFGDSLKNILKLDKNPDIIFIDPPYTSDLYEKALKIIYDNNILNQNGIIVLEHPLGKDILKNGFDEIKAKVYGNVQITYLIHRNN